MLADFQQHIQDDFPELLQKHFLLACSGGVDSMVLTALCKTLKLDFAIAHCNFQLREEASVADAEFVKKIAEKYKIKYYVIDFDTDSYVIKNKVSVQVAARELRYAWFAEIMQQNGIEIMVTAHHADDNLETFLINLSRGTGIEGLNGIPAKNDPIYRPLLPFSRAQIEAYAATEQIDWREDASNKETKYLRNKIRHDIVPLLKTLHPTFLENFNKTQEHLAGTSDFLKATIEKSRNTLFINKEGLVTISIADLQELYPQKTILYELFKDYGFTAWNDIFGLLTASSGKEVRSKTHRLVKDRNTLLLTKLATVTKRAYTIEALETEMNNPIRLRFEEVSAIGQPSANALYVDKETLKYPLTVRKWENGDYFYPLGMQGKKKLSKYFKDEKIDIITKENQWLLCSENDLVWVVGRRGDERFKVTEHTKNIVKITFNK
ncbi:tRNA lysidine(34) synthetase TilS [Maribacter sp.]|nr:tRNA lysidine(34) synthetase TilS [Maribacter sp.]